MKKDKLECPKCGEYSFIHCRSMKLSICGNCGYEKKD